MRGYYPGERERREGARQRIPSAADPRSPADRELHLLEAALRRRRAGRAGAGAPRRRRRRGERARPERRRAPPIDWIVGIVLGIVLGMAVIVGFLVFGSEDTIDAPSIHGVDNGKPLEAVPRRAEGPAAPRRSR